MLRPSSLTTATVVLLMNIIQCELIYPDSYLQSIELIQKDPDHLSSVMVVSAQCKQCPDALQIYEAFSKESEGVVNTVVLDCAIMMDVNHLPACKNAEYLPQVSFLQPPSDEYDPNNPKNQELLKPKEHKLKGSLSLESLRKALIEYAPLFSRKLKSKQQLSSFLSDPSIPNKVLLILEESDSDIPMWWRAITAYYRSRINFGVCGDSDMIPPEFDLNGVYPDLLILKGGEQSQQYTQVKYKGGKRFESLRAFLSKYALANKVRRWKSPYEDAQISQEQEVIQLDFNQFKQLKHDQWVLVQYQQQQQQQLINQQQFNVLKQDFRQLFKYYSVSCEQQCPTQQLRILNWQSNKAPFIVQSDDISSTIAELLLQHVPIHPTQPQLLYQAIRNILASQKYAILTTYDSTHPIQTLSIATLAKLPKYKNRLQFLFLKDPDEQTRKQWELVSTPAMVAFAGIDFSNGQHQRYDYEGKYEYDQIQAFLNQISLKHQQGDNSRTVDQAIKNVHFENFCLNPEKPCAIALLNPRSKNFKLELDVIEKTKFNVQQQTDLSWIWVDAKCQHYLAKRLNIQALPAFILYNPKKNKYAKLQTPYTAQNLVAFIQTSKKSYIKIDDYLDLQVV